MKQIRVAISGIVQGVSFRFFIKEEAEKLGVTGFVKNNTDGTVEALFQGSQDSIGKMVRRCLKGPKNADVNTVRILDAPEPIYQDFVIKA